MWWIFWAKDKDHMSGKTVIFFRLLILANLLLCGTIFLEPYAPIWIMVLCSVISVVSLVGLIMLLRGYKRGGYIGGITSGLNVLFVVILGITEMNDGIYLQNVEILTNFLAVSIFNIIFILTIMLGSGKAFLK